MCTQNAAPWLSVIVPVYNAEKYLRQCIESILNQSFTDFELILVNDGSKDRSGDLCLEYAAKDSRIRYFQKENGGSFQTRVYGAVRMRGTYFTFCDADDYYVSGDVFHFLYEELKSNPCDVLQFTSMKKYNHLTKHTDFRGSAFTLTRNEFLRHEYPKLLCSFWDDAHLTNNLWNKVYHKRLLQWSPDPDRMSRIFWGDDLITNLYLLEHCQSIRFVPNELYVYRQFSGGTSSFSRTTMRDLDQIKAFQSQFLERQAYENRDEIEHHLHKETAGWFFGYIKQALDFLTDDEILDMIRTTLEMPAFVKARAFFQSHTEETWEPVTLLRKSDASAYLAAAKLRKEKPGLKEKIRGLLKAIYVRI